MLRRARPGRGAAGAAAHAHRRVPAPADGCASYQALYEGLAELEADTHLHVHKENNVLFPAVVALEERWPRPAS